MGTTNEVRIRPVILCGGSGTRLWPTSRETMPKQFAVLLGKRSTFQETLLRVRNSKIFGRPLVVTNATHRFLAEMQMREVGVDADILIEPIARDSGPAIAAASVYLQEKSPGAPALVLAADHLVRDVPAFVGVVKAGLAAALAGRIVTFGILPTQPATGYGYIEPGEAVEGGARTVKRFVEKPDSRTALNFMSAGYLWNSGNFMFLPETVLREYEAFDPESIALVREAVTTAGTDLGAVTLSKDLFGVANRISFDYAVMERTAHAAVVAGSFGWSDVGSWDALWELSDKDDEGNAARGTVVFAQSRNNYASSDEALVTLLGVENLVVVSTRDAVLVADRTKATSVKALVEKLHAEGHPEATISARVYRPWGWYQTLDLAQRFQVKRIVVFPNGRLSLQKHFHRAEHWVVVKGTARITLGEKVQDLTENQSVYIPLGSVHRLENPGKINAEIIEVQTGTYLGEDDIERLEDDYRRG